MVENAKLMKCGGCGSEEFKVFCTEKNSSSVDKLFIECKECKSVNEIVLTPPKISLSWEGEGGLAVF